MEIMTNERKLKEKNVNNIKKITTSGTHLNQLFLLSIYFIFFIILILFLILSIFSYNINMKLVDYWPIFVFIILLIFSSAMIVETFKLRTKRTIQKDMRET